MTMATAKKNKKQSFEEAITELEATVAKLEQDDISLDESISLFTRGVELSGLCNNILNEIEGRIVKLVAGDSTESDNANATSNANSGANAGAGADAGTDADANADAINNSGASENGIIVKELPF